MPSLPSLQLKYLTFHDVVKRSALPPWENRPRARLCDDRRTDRALRFPDPRGTTRNGSTSHPRAAVRGTPAVGQRLPLHRGDAAAAEQRVGAVRRPRRVVGQPRAHRPDPARRVGHPGVGGAHPGARGVAACRDPTDGGDPGLLCCSACSSGSCTTPSAQTQHPSAGAYPTPIMPTRARDLRSLGGRGRLDAHRGGVRRRAARPAPRSRGRPHRRAPAAEKAATRVSMLGWLTYRVDALSTPTRPERPTRQELTVLTSPTRRTRHCLANVLNIWDARPVSHGYDSIRRIVSTLRAKRPGGQSPMTRAPWTGPVARTA